MWLIKMKKSRDIIRLIHRGSGGQQGWIYSVNGLMSTIPASGYKDPPKIVVLDEKRKCDEQDNSDRKYER